MDSKTGQLVRVQKTVTIGGGYSGPPSMIDLLGARQRLRPVATRDGGWDKSEANIGIILEILLKFIYFCVLLLILYLKEWICVRIWRAEVTVLLLRSPMKPLNCI